jgi:hypothetical protein
MDLRTFRRNGPGLAECESQAAWRRLWADRRAHRSRDTRGPVSNVAASWPQFGYRGKPIEGCAWRALARQRTCDTPGQVLVLIEIGMWNDPTLPVDAVEQIRGCIPRLHAVSHPRSRVDQCAGESSGYSGSVSTFSMWPVSRQFGQPVVEYGVVSRRRLN